MRRPGSAFSSRSRSQPAARRTGNLGPIGSAQTSPVERVWLGHTGAGTLDSRDSLERGAAARAVQIGPDHGSAAGLPGWGIAHDRDMDRLD